MAYLTNIIGSYISWLGHQGAETENRKCAITPKLMVGLPPNFLHVHLVRIHDIPCHPTFPFYLIFNFTEVHVLSTIYEFASLIFNIHRVLSTLAPATYWRCLALTKEKKTPADAFNPSQNAIIRLQMHKKVHKTLLRSLQKHCQMVFSRFLSTTIFIPAENTRHSEKPEQNPSCRSGTYNMPCVALVDYTLLSSMKELYSKFP
jgi:hypothetical protein